MNSVSLRQYCEEMKGLIRQGELDEAIAVGRHILTFYPKYVSPYRLMGEAALEKESYDEAADLFRRVLGADPEDVVSHVALAVIHDETRAYDEAIWHLELAFELAPGNAEIRQELIRLYTARDGSPPQRLKLTPAALGRLYLSEGLYDRAVAELEPLLQVEPERLDISLAVAEALWRQDRRWEASEHYQKVLADLPYSLKANLIQGTLLLQGGRPDEARPHLQRARALDPENMLAATLFGEHTPLRPEPVLIARLGDAAPPTEPPSPELQPPVSAEMPGFEPEPAPSEPAAVPHRLAETEPPPATSDRPPEEAEPEPGPPGPEPAPQVSEPEPLLQDDPTWLVSLEKKAKGQTGSGASAEGVPDWLLSLRGLSHETEPAPEPEEEEGAAQPEAAEPASAWEPAAEDAEAAVPKPAGPVSEWEPVTEEEAATLEPELSESEPPDELPAEWPSRHPAEQTPPGGPETTTPDQETGAPEIEAPERPAWPSSEGSPTPPTDQPPEEDEEPELAWPAPPEAEAIGEPQPEQPTAAESAEEMAPPPAPETPAVEPDIPSEPEPPTEFPREEPGSVTGPEERAQPLPAEEPAPEEGVAEMADAPPEEEAGEDSESLLEIARNYIEEGDLGASVEQYHRLVHRSAGIPKEAMRDLEDLAQRSPDRVEIQQLLGDAYMRDGRLQEALRVYREIRTHLIPS